MGKKAGCVPVRRRGNPSSSEWEVLLVQSRWTPAVWLFPKGGVEHNESAKAAAVRETCEEGGVIGELGPKLGVWTFDRGSKQKQKMWLLFVSTEYGSDSKLWKERKKRLRAWFSFDDARRKLTEIPKDIQRPELTEMLEKADKALKDIANGALPAAEDGGHESDDELSED